MKKIKPLCLVITLLLISGVLYRLTLTYGGNFLFNMDNARDMVDLREMMVLGKLRLTGPTSAIEGFFNGPFWYYLLAIPFSLSGGDPYASILMEIVLWTIGGFFLLRLISRWGNWLVWPIGALWIASDYIVLTNLYAFNPNPVALLAPLFIYLLVEYLDKKKTIYGIYVWILAGLFFNFEMNFGIFIPPIILASTVFTGNANLLKQKWFWVGVAVFVATLLPQVIFDLKHQFIMSKALLRHLSENSDIGFNIVKRLQIISESFYNTFQATLMNHQLFTRLILVFFIPVIYWFLKVKKKETVVCVSFLLIFIPFLGYLILPVTVNPWHLGGEMTAALILVGYLLKKLLMEKSFVSKIISAALLVSIIWFALLNIVSFNGWRGSNFDPSLYKNEIAVIDYVYKIANGVNFKVYTYLPSVYDYPYQYLFWWYGQKKYGYIPGEYVYSPDKPVYIPSQEKFQGSKKNFSGLVFLIKEPDRIKMRQAWEGDFKDMEFVSKEMLGSIEIEIRKE
ncbi:MAG: glycosyltransferase family 39 protein [Candidatus Daviesbacteria bacterium]|nr:glycosyltransferase family 39 protein [Candidatus Daviesbacteria bacterium]